MKTSVILPLLCILHFGQITEAVNEPPCGNFDLDHEQCLQEALKGRTDRFRSQCYLYKYINYIHDHEEVGSCKEQCDCSSTETGIRWKCKNRCGCQMKCDKSEKTTLPTESPTKTSLSLDDASTHVTNHFTDTTPNMSTKSDYTWKETTLPTESSTQTSLDNASTPEPAHVTEATNLNVPTKNSDTRIKTTLPTESSTRTSSLSLDSRSTHDTNHVTEAEPNVPTKNGGMWKQPTPPVNSPIEVRPSSTCHSETTAASTEPPLEGLEIGPSDRDAYGDGITLPPKSVQNLIYMYIFLIMVVIAVLVLLLYVSAKYKGPTERNPEKANLLDPERGE